MSRLNSCVVFIGDLHLGHRTIVEHSGDKRGGATVEEHDEWVIAQCLSVQPTKRTLWYILGDVAMNIDRLSLLDELPGRKILVLGNHDTMNSQVYLKYFERIVGGFKKYDMWITHMPMHALELYGRPNIHGHTHYNTLWHDPRYLNAAIEWLPDRRPITLDEVNQAWKRRMVAYASAKVMNPNLIPDNPLDGSAP